MGVAEGPVIEVYPYRNRSCTVSLSSINSKVDNYRPAREFEFVLFGGNCKALNIALEFIPMTSSVSLTEVSRTNEKDPAAGGINSKPSQAIQVTNKEPSSSSFSFEGNWEPDSFPAALNGI